MLTEWLPLELPDEPLVLFELSSPASDREWAAVVVIAAARGNQGPEGNQKNKRQRCTSHRFEPPVILVAVGAANRANHNW